VTRLEEIKDRLENTTPGPFQKEPLEKHGAVSLRMCDGKRSGIVYVCTSLNNALNDAKFIAHSREDVEYLLDLIERMVDRVNGL